MLRRALIAFAVLASSMILVTPAQGGVCPDFPSDNIWNVPIDGLPLDPMSSAYVNAIGGSAGIHADFGSGVWPPGSSSPIGIPFIEVPSGQPLVGVTFTAYGDESDPGPYPIPADAPIEGGSSASGDRHVIVVDRDRCQLYELFSAFPNGDGTWRAASGAVWDLGTNDLRPSGWTSADAAGLPIYPGLVRYDEIVAGEIDHAIRFTAPRTRSDYVWPARHDASSSSDPGLPPMGQRFRLKADYDISGMSQTARIIATAMKKYGLILADNGSPWYISGAPDGRWSNDVLHELDVLMGSDFVAVDSSSLMVDPDSAGTSEPLTRLAGVDRYATAAAVSAATFAGGSSVVYVATGENYPDALAAVPAAIRRNAPILLTRSKTLPGATATELARLNPSQIVVLGGTSAVSVDVASRLGAYGTVSRISGSDRYATAAAVSRDTFPGGASVVYLATGTGFADALAAGPGAGIEGAPVLLTQRDRVPSVIRTEIVRLGAAEVVVLGGVAAVSQAVETSLESLGVQVTRIGGADRYATAAAVSRRGFSSGVPVTFAATGDGFPDALAGGVAAGLGGGPVLLVNATAVPGPTRLELSRLATSRIVVLGGRSAIPTQISLELAGYRVP